MAAAASSPRPWTHVAATPSGPSPRAGHTLSYCPPLRRCLLFAGASHEDGFSNDLYSLDTDSLEWSPVSVDASESDALPPARYEHTGEIVTPCGGNPQLMVMYGAGDQGLLADVWAFDLATRRWAEWLTNGKAPCPRTIHSVGHVRVTTSVEDSEADATAPATYEKSRLYVFGGGVENDVAAKDAVMYCLDVDTMFWIQVSTATQTPSPPPRLGHTLTAVSTNVYLFGGLNGEVAYNDLWVFDTVSRTWTLLQTSGDIPSARSAHTATAYGTDIYIFGGFSREGKPHVHGEIFVIDTVTCMWRKEHTSGGAARLDHDACVASIHRNAGKEDGELKATPPGLKHPRPALLVFGGMDLEGMTNSLHMYEFLSAA
ncbi:hypothetical protein HDU88_004616 [Geranomyces variabilis]|nr:hypothetical protein HDU88_004616 [Geranomyces variabilis]